MERGHLEGAFASWEDELLQYEHKEGKSNLSDDDNTAVLMHRTRGQLQEHVRLNSAHCLNIRKSNKSWPIPSRQNISSARILQRIQMTWALGQSPWGKDKLKGKEQAKARTFYASNSVVMGAWLRNVCQQDT